MDDPPPILAYVTAPVAMKQEGRAVSLTPPPPGWEIALFSVALFAFGIGVLLGGALAIDRLFRSDRDFAGFFGSLMMAAICGFAGVATMKKLLLRRRFGHLPFSVEPEGTDLVFYFPARWGARQERLPKIAVTRFTVRRNGWSTNLRPQYWLFVHTPLRVWLKVPFVAMSKDEVTNIEPLLNAMLQPPAPRE
jgi:hypothetical protein